jgi:20S proteasome alpha/beta subunit
MPLVLAIKNQTSVVVASDTDSPTDGAIHFGQLITLPNRTAILIAGNLVAVRHAVMDVVVPKLSHEVSAAGLAQLLQAALTLEVVPKLTELKGRVELIVAGIDPVRHVEEPGIYYLDSAAGFRLQLPPGDFMAAGSTAAVAGLLAGHRFTDSSTDHLQVLAKECLAATKLRWPTALGNHMRLGTITSQNTRLQDF